MPSDVSDEGLERIVFDAFSKVGPLKMLNHVEALELARRIRDLTAAACRHTCHERALYLARSGNDDAAHGAAGSITDIASAFPGAAAAEGNPIANPET